MIEYIFVIFGFGVAITAIVAKGVFMSVEFARTELNLEAPGKVEEHEALFTKGSASIAPSPTATGIATAQMSGPTAVTQVKKLEL